MITEEKKQLTYSKTREFFDRVQKDTWFNTLQRSVDGLDMT